MFSQTCTVFCYQKNKTGSVRWYPCVLEGVSWYAKSKTSVMSYQKSSLLSENTFAVNIPVCVNAFGKTFLPPAAFEVSDTPQHFWTLQHNAIVVKGAVSQEFLDRLAEKDGLLTLDKLLASFPLEDRFVVREYNLSCKGSPAVAHYRVCGS